MALTLDRRERLLSQALDGFPHELTNLAAGDVLCRYEDNTEWIAEPKPDTLLSSLVPLSNRMPALVGYI